MCTRKPTKRQMNASHVQLMCDNIVVRNICVVLIYEMFNIAKYFDHYN